MAKTLEKDLEKIGKRLKEIRVTKGYTSYRQFAYTFDMEPKSVWLIEEGKSDFKYSSLKRILDAYGVSITEFYNSL